MYDTTGKIDIDTQLFNYVCGGNCQSFFLYAGAGSGKTRSLINLLVMLREHEKERLKLNGQKIAVITYTNAACNNIISRLEHNDCFSVSTIHSFIWEQIRPYTLDIKNWLREKTTIDLDALKIEVGAAKNTTTKTYREKIKRIAKYEKRLVNLDSIKFFTYDPMGQNNKYDSLGHSQIIEIGACFLSNKPLMQKIFIKKYPILLIDESQDTNRTLVDAFLKIQATHSSAFALGLFGDSMQRIYFDGKDDIDSIIPDSWMKPAKIINYRCPKRIVRLINKIRAGVDEHQQLAHDNSDEGIVRFYIFPHTVNKENTEQNIAMKMAELTDDEQWCNDYNCFILEHQMAAQRLNCSDFFEPLYKVKQYKDSLRDGSMSELRLFTNMIFPLIEYARNDEKFKISEIAKCYSPIFEEDNLIFEGKYIERIQKANIAVKSLVDLFKDNAIPAANIVVKNLLASGLFHVPPTLRSACTRSFVNVDNTDLTPEELSKAEAWHKALQVPIDQIMRYSKYISGETKFSTHHGVKGLQFPRVMVIMDDKSARGRTFSYDKLFAHSKISIPHLGENPDNSIENTKRLFYVVCSRAEKSLALVSYTENPEALKQHLIDKKWFSEDEIICNY